MKPLKYPPTQTVDHARQYQGTFVADPYRWLEDVDSLETRNWIAAQNELTFAFLAGIPARDRIRQRLTEMWDYPKASAPKKCGGRYFQLRNTGLQNQDELYVLETPEDEGRVLLDPNSLSEDGMVALNQWESSRDGRYLAYATSSSGSDWLTWRVRDVDTAEDLPDQIEWSKFSGAAWLPNNRGFIYGRYDPPAEGQTYAGVNYYQKRYMHCLGDLQEKDLLVYERPDQKEWGFDATISRDGLYLLLHVWQGTDTRNRIIFKELSSEANFIELIPDLEANYQFVGNDGPRFYFRTDLDAPCGRLIAIDTTNPDRSTWVTLIPEVSDVVESIRMVNNQFIILYQHDAYHRIERFDLQGNSLGEISLPALGSLVIINFNLSLYGERDDSQLFYAFQSFVHPPTVYKYDFLTKTSESLFAPQIAFDFSPYVTRQVFVTSKDGTQVPMFLVHQRDLVNSGKNPTLLYGYGGFSVSINPTFMVSRSVWLEMGGVLAVANLRGGNEYGEEWHQAGYLHHKQNVFDDMIACAEYLISSGITTTSHLAIEGRSNGGLLVGACLTQRPDLFGAALPAVGVMDMLRFHKFTIGWAWVSDYGSADDPEQFQDLLRYSPLHNLKPGVHYPATLVTTGDHDDRVVPGHSFKFIAALQATQAGQAPVLIRTQTKAGHGFGKPTAIMIEEQGDILAFLVKVLKMN